MSSLDEEFRAQLVEKLEAAGHRLGVSKAHAALNIDHADVRVAIRVAIALRRRSWTPRITSVTIGGGEYRGPQGKRFNARKAGWDWDAIVHACVEEAARKLARDKRDRELRKKREALEDDPATKQALKLSYAIGVVTVEHSGITLKLLDLTPAMTLAVLKLVKEGTTP